MKRILFCIAITLLFFPNGYAQSKSEISSGNKMRGGIRSVDFRNFTYSNIGGNDRVTLRRGRNLVKGDYSSGTYGSQITTIKYLDFNGDGKEEALVVVDYSQEAAGAYWEQHYFIFAYQNGRAQQIFHESRYKGGNFRLSGKSLIVEAPFWKNEDAHCCPSLAETATYAWRGNKFALISYNEPQNSDR